LWIFEKIANDSFLYVVYIPINFCGFLKKLQKNEKRATVRTSVGNV